VTGTGCQGGPRDLRDSPRRMQQVGVDSHRAQTADPHALVAAKVMFNHSGEIPDPPALASGERVRSRPDPELSEKTRAADAVT